jgi:hypothetical protein
MEIHGSLSENLGAALRSMRRLRGHSVHSDTIEYWYSLIAHARGQVRSGRASAEAGKMLEVVTLELAERLERKAPLV